MSSDWRFRSSSWQVPLWGPGEVVSPASGNCTGSHTAHCAHPEVSQPRGPDPQGLLQDLFSLPCYLAFSLGGLGSANSGPKPVVFLMALELSMIFMFFQMIGKNHNILGPVQMIWNSMLVSINAVLLKNFQAHSCMCGPWLLCCYKGRNRMARTAQNINPLVL